MRSHDLEIANPCHESWEAMQGAGARRFCGVCRKDVHDLSAMAHTEARALLRAHTGASLCVRYTAEPDGTLRFRDLVPRASLTRKIVRTAVAAAMLAACAPSGGAPAIHDLGASILDAIREDTVPTMDGGCDYASGPFTTFHLPPGHALCRHTGADTLAVAPVSFGTLGAGEEEPPPDPPPDAVPWVDPDPPPAIGQAMAAPEPGPLVPCEPGLDPRPPTVEPASRSLPVKGRIKIQPQKPEPRRKMGTMVAPDDL
jgi:hypothetical protein